MPRFAGALADRYRGRFSQPSSSLSDPVSCDMTSVLDLELQRLRTMTASEKVAVMQSLWRQAWSLKLAGVRAQHPEWTPVQVDDEVRAIFLKDSE